MGLTKFPNGLSSFGMPIIGAGGIMTTGSVFFVNSVIGSDGNSGLDPDHPLATIDAAINKCTANKGDVIFCMPNHAETAATAALFAADVAGISIIGLGNGDDRPTITLGTSTGADVDLAADNVLIRNMKFDLTAVDAIAAGIDVDGAYITIEDCEILMGDSDGQATVAVDVGVSSHGFAFRRNHMYNDDAGGSYGVRFTNVSNDVVVEDNHIHGAFSTAVIASSDGTTVGLPLLLRMRIENNRLFNTASGLPCVSFGATTIASTGIICDNYLGITGTAGGTLVGYGGNTRMFNNYISNNSSAQGEILPAVDGVAAT